MDEQRSDQDAVKSGNHPILPVMIALMTADLAAAFETTMIFASINTFLEEFGSPTGVGWLITSYLLVSASAAALVGRLGDIYGRKRVLLIVLSLAAFGSLLSAVASDLSLVIVGRAIQGFAGAALPLCVGLTRQLLPQRYMSMGIALVTTTSSLGGAVGFIVGGALAEHFHWSSIFVTSSGLAVGALGLSAMLLPNVPASGQSGRLDVLGGVLFVLGIVAVLIAISNIGKWGVGDPRTMGLLAAAVASIALWVRHELRHPNPLIDVRLLADRRSALANITMALFALGGMQMALMQTLLLQQPSSTGIGLGISAALAGLLQALGIAIAIVTGPLSGYVSMRLGAKTAMIGALSIMTAGIGGMALLNGSVDWMLATMIMASAGITGFVAAHPNIVVAAVPAGRTSEAVGFSGVVRAIGQAIGNQIVVALLASSTVVAAAGGTALWPSPAAFMLAFAYLLLGCGLVMVSAFFLPGRQACTA